MDLAYSHAPSQRVLKQRNMLLVISLAFAGLSAVLGVTAAARDCEVVLQPVLRTPLTISSAGVSREYLEAVTRDAAVLTLNRTPQSLEYWMTSVLEMVHPSAYGQVKGDLLKIVEDQRGSSIAQFGGTRSTRHRGKRPATSRRALSPSSRNPRNSILISKPYLRSFAP